MMEDLHLLAAPPLYVSRRSEVTFLESAWHLPNVVRKPTIQKVRVENNDGEGPSVTLDFSDGSSVDRVDKVVFATGYRLAYPFLPFPDGSVTPHNRLANFYQHVFCIDDPSLTVIGQVRAAISLRIYEYQAVAVARFLAGHAAGVLPSVEEQRAWERDRLAYKGPTELFHEIKPDFTEYYGWLRSFAGPPSPDSLKSGAYELPQFEDWWVDCDIEVIIKKAQYWDYLRGGGKYLD